MINDDVLSQLYARRRFGIKIGLEVVQAMLECLDNPQDSYGVVHVAGTNGKGSVSAMLESVLHSAGYKTGLYTSPHLVRLNERFRVSMKDISDEELAGLIDDVERCALSVEKDVGREATFFEVTTVIAMEYFKRSGVEIAVLETGMGGRFDATNVVLPMLSVVTRISMDHAEHLGDDLSKIAFEKAGIIKKGRPVICGAMDTAAASVIRQAAHDNGSEFISAEDTVKVCVKQVDLSGQKVAVDSEGGGFGTIRLPLLGIHQCENLAICASAVEELRVIGVNISDAAFKDGIMNLRWAGRFQLLSNDPVVILDGAHNPAAAECLVGTIRKSLGIRHIALVFGACADKDIRGTLKPLLSLTRKAWCVALSNERGEDPSRLAAICAEYNVESDVCDVRTAIASAKSWAKENDAVVLIAGSLFLVGDVLEVNSER